MMDRLINANKLLEEIRRDRDYAEKNGFMDMYYERQALIDRIEAQPTAYDLDKVMEQLEAISDKIPLQYEYNYEKGMSDGINEAIEIAKGGGI